jgi:hypothetical protein
VPPSRSLYLCATCAELLSERVPGSSRIVADLTQLFAAYLAEKYTRAASAKPEVRGGLPIRQLQKVGDFVTEHLAEEISVEILAQLVAGGPSIDMDNYAAGSIVISIYGRGIDANDYDCRSLFSGNGERRFFFWRCPNHRGVI